jgi:hypothetical protein
LAWKDSRTRKTARFASVDCSTASIARSTAPACLRSLGQRLLSCRSRARVSNCTSTRRSSTKATNAGQAFRASGVKLGRAKQSPLKPIWNEGRWSCSCLKVFTKVIHPAESPARSNTTAGHQIAARSATDLRIHPTQSQPVQEHYCSTACSSQRCTSKSSAGGIGAGPPVSMALRKAAQQATWPLSCERRRRVLKPGMPQAWSLR